MNNPLVQVDPGLFIWTIATFLVLLTLLAKFAWGPLLQALAAHRTAAVEDDLHRSGRPQLGPRCFGSTQLEEHGQLVGLLNGDELDVDVRVQVHRLLLSVTGIEVGSSPAGVL